MVAVESGAEGCWRNTSDTSTATGAMPGANTPSSSPSPRDATAPAGSLLQTEGGGPAPRGLVVHATRLSSQQPSEDGDVQAPVLLPCTPPDNYCQATLSLPPAAQPPQEPSHADIRPPQEESAPQEPPPEVEAEGAPAAGVADAGVEAPMVQEARARRRSPSGSGSHGPTHRTLPLREAVPSAVVGAVVPSLLDLCIKTIVSHSQSVEDIRGVDEVVTLRLLREVLCQGRLTYRLAKVFIDSGHDDIAQALSSLNLWDALPLETSKSRCTGCCREE